MTLIQLYRYQFQELLECSLLVTRTNSSPCRDPDMTEVAFGPPPSPTRQCVVCAFLLSFHPPPELSLSTFSPQAYRL
jgi:hypothetical protein